MQDTEEQILAVIAASQATPNNNHLLFLLSMWVAFPDLLFNWTPLASPEPLSFNIGKELMSEFGAGWHCGVSAWINYIYFSHSFSGLTWPYSHGHGESVGVSFRNKANILVFRPCFASALLMSKVSLGQTQRLCGALQDCGVLGNRKKWVIRGIRPSEILSSFCKATYFGILCPRSLWHMDWLVVKCFVRSFQVKTKEEFKLAHFNDAHHASNRDIVY